jgi:hypothetical protein
MPLHGLADTGQDGPEPQHPVVLLPVPLAPGPGILAASGPMTAAADRIKDAATGRGRD